MYPAPAVGRIANNDPTSKGGADSNDNAKEFPTHQSRLQPGTLPESAMELPKGARGLLVRLLERDPRVRMRSLRQMQQSAFYMGFNFEHVKAKKVSPQTILKNYFPEDVPETSVEDLRLVSQAVEDLRLVSQDVFSTFDQPSIV